MAELTIRTGQYRHRIASVTELMARPDDTALLHEIGIMSEPTIRPSQTYGKGSRPWPN
jgi:hypothetical protein